MAISPQAQRNHDALFPNHASTLQGSDPELVEIFDNWAFGEVLEQEVLDVRTRLMVQLAAIIACQAVNEYRVMLGGALNVGVTPVEVKEIVYQAVPYVGMARGFDFLHVTNEVFRNRGFELPLEGQSTTSPETRLDKGLEAQRRIFGDRIDQMYAASPKDQLHMQRHLSANCFGDYYTRTGLDLKQRELLTFSMLASLGGCEAQLGGHVAGNLAVGNDRHVLVGTVTLLLPFIGYPRTLNANPGHQRRDLEMMDKNNIQGKVVVITGASSGLGEAAARHLSAQGATVVLGARRAERIQALANELVGRGAKAAAIPTDVTDRLQVKRLVDAAIQNYGRIDVMLNNAGLMPHSPLERLKVDDWERMIDVNVKGVLYGIAAALPHMQRQKSGHFINVSSVAGHKIRAGGVVYAATKHAVRAISEGLRMEVKPYNIRTTVISPGAVATELVDGITEPDIRESVRAMTREMALPAEAFARIVSFAINQPEDVDLNEILFRPTRQEF